MEKRLPPDGMNYTLLLIKLNCGDYMRPFEPFYRETRKLSIRDHDLEKVKTGIRY